MKYRNIIISIALLLASMTLYAQQSSAEREQQFVQRLQEAQMSGNDKDFYKAHDAFLDYLEKRKEWDKYYRTRMSLIIYEVNNKRFHRAFTTSRSAIMISTSTCRTWAWASSIMAATSTSWPRLLPPCAQGHQRPERPYSRLQCLPLTGAVAQLQAPRRGDGMP